MVPRPMVRSCSEEFGGGGGGRAWPKVYNFCSHLVSSNIDFKPTVVIIIIFTKDFQPSEYLISSGKGR